MGTEDTARISRQAVLTLSEIKAAVEAFDRGDANVFDALDSIVLAIESYQHAGSARKEAA